MSDHQEEAIDLSQWNFEDLLETQVTMTESAYKKLIDELEDAKSRVTELEERLKGLENKQGSPKK